MIEKVNELLLKVFDKLSMNYIAAIALGLLAIIFLIVVAASMGGNLSKFKKLASSIIKDPSPKNINIRMQFMPVKVRKLYKRAMIERAKPGDLINVDACVNVPFMTSLASKLAGIMTISTIFVAGIFGFLTYAFNPFSAITMMALVIVLGSILTLIAAVISRGIFNGAIKKYDAMIDAMDNMSKDSTVINTPDEQIMDNEIVAEVEQPVQHKKIEDFDGPNHITVEIDDSKTVDNIPIDDIIEPEIEVAEQPNNVEQAKNDEARLREAAMARAEARAQAEREAREAARAEALAKARAEAQARTEARAQAAKVAESATVTVQPTQTTAPPSNADDVIARIEKINQEGAPLATMKEVALLLQQERAKPENKTPEQQRKLNEALSKLLKAMSTANKR